MDIVYQVTIHRYQDEFFDWWRDGGEQRLTRMKLKWLP